MPRAVITWICTLLYSRTSNPSSPQPSAAAISVRFCADVTCEIVGSVVEAIGAGFYRNLTTKDTKEHKGRKPGNGNAHMDCSALGKRRMGFTRARLHLRPEGAPLCSFVSFVVNALRLS